MLGANQQEFSGGCSDILEPTDRGENASCIQGIRYDSLGTVAHQGVVCLLLHWWLCSARAADQEFESSISDANCVFVALFQEAEICMCTSQIIESSLVPLETLMRPAVPGESGRYMLQTPDARRSQEGLLKPEDSRT